MKLATLVIEGNERVALVSPETDEAWLIEAGSDGPITDMIDLIERFERVKADLKGGDAPVTLSSTQVKAPIPVPSRNIMCVGKNYRAHAEEFELSSYGSGVSKDGNAAPEHPIIFTKVPQTVIANGDSITYPHGASDSVDYEAELGLVIGKAGRGISKENALEHVFGYTIINDVTARDMQAKHKQWFIGKSFDTFCPMGPWLVTADEVDETNLQVRCWVNDELRQDANTADLIFDIPTIIENLSAGITLRPGDVIATGTPAGVGLAFPRPNFFHRVTRSRLRYRDLGVLLTR